MKQTVKKNIAREFLFLLGSTITFFLILFLWMFLASRNDKKIDELQNEIASIEREFQKNYFVVNEVFDFKENSEKLYKVNDSNKENIEKLEILKVELKDRKKSFFNSSIHEDVVIPIGIIILSMVFGFRYLIYATKWSLAQIKNN